MTRIYLVETTISGPQAFSNMPAAMKRAETHMAEFCAWAEITGGGDSEFIENDVVNANMRSWSRQRGEGRDPDWVRVTSLAVQ